MRELVEEDWGFYAVMDLADNEFAAVSAEYRPKTLASVIESEKALPLSVCVKLGIALTKGLAALQRHHLLHRDIKPGNVIYVDGHPVLSDPGLVVALRHVFIRKHLHFSHFILVPTFRAGCLNHGSGGIGASLTQTLKNPLSLAGLGTVSFVSPVAGAAAPGHLNPSRLAADATA